MKRNFNRLLSTRWEQNKFICPGLDPALDLIPAWFKKRHKNVSETFVAYNRAIIDATASEVCAYKPNSALYESQGREGWIALEETFRYLQSKYPEIPVILDGKRNEIGRTNEYYAQAAFEVLGADAITLNPWAGIESLKPYMDREGKGSFVLCRMTNPGSEQYQEVVDSASGLPVYKLVARDLYKTSETVAGTPGLVVGAQHPQILIEVREIVGESMPLLIPGTGVQGGSTAEAVKAAATKKGGIILSTGRAIMFASENEDFEEKARERCIEYNTEVKTNLPK